MTTLGERAKATLHVRGWHKKGEAVWGPQPLCLVEVLKLHAPGFGITLVDATERLGFESYNEAVAWNDAPERTFEEVLKRLESI